jgi:hypothetical protein
MKSTDFLSAAADGSSSLLPGTQKKVVQRMLAAFFAFGLIFFSKKHIFFLVWYKNCQLCYHAGKIADQPLTAF